MKTQLGVPVLKKLVPVIVSVVLEFIGIERGATEEIVGTTTQIRKTEYKTHRIQCSSLHQREEHKRTGHRHKFRY